MHGEPLWFLTKGLINEPLKSSSFSLRRRLLSFVDEESKPRRVTLRSLAQLTFHGGVAFICLFKNGLLKQKIGTRRTQRENIPVRVCEIFL
ncbi:hypothetical protein HanPI659440_Chr04g0143511 [Helianthus annuus]|nr:hypothetical protein HanPI659440_Chr04g0143511 [Helianthus annuus]